MSNFPLLSMANFLQKVSGNGNKVGQTSTSPYAAVTTTTVLPEADPYVPHRKIQRVYATSTSGTDRIVGADSYVTREGNAETRFTLANGGGAGGVTQFNSISGAPWHATPPMIQARSQRPAPAPAFTRPNLGPGSSPWALATKAESKGMTEDSVYSSILFDLESKKIDKEDWSGTDHWFERNLRDVQDNVWHAVVDVSEGNAEHPFVRTANKTGSNSLDPSVYHYNSWLVDPTKDPERRAEHERFLMRHRKVMKAAERFHWLQYMRKYGDLVDGAQAIANSYDEERSWDLK